MKTPAQILKEAREKAHLEGPAAAARKFGWKESTYTSHENGTRAISKKAARQYARAFGINPAALLVEGASPEDGAERNFVVIGESAVGLWRDITLEKELPRPLRFPDVGAGSPRRKAIKVSDNSVNRTIAPGEFAIFEPVDPGEASSLPVNSLVVVDRVRGQLRERTIRRIRGRKGAALELVCHSTEKRFSETLYSPSPKGSETIEIVGRVVGKYGDIDPTSI